MTDFELLEACFTTGNYEGVRKLVQKVRETADDKTIPVVVYLKASAWAWKAEQEAKSKKELRIALKGQKSHV